MPGVREIKKWKKFNNGDFQSPQIGSYFGATLCSVDLDRDKNTDLVLIGAPMYYDGMAGGVVYICERQVGEGECRPALCTWWHKATTKSSYLWTGM